MTITSTSIRLLESERMADTPDGGGRRTNNVIVDGEAGNVFPKVSRVDSVYGRVNFRKIFGHVNTVTVETYAGAHAIITDAPDNPRIGVVLFATGNDFDTRADARDRVESYVIAGPESRMVVYGRQLKNASAVLLYQRVEEQLPEVGDVYCLSDETGNVIGAQQFIRVQDVSHEVRTFSENNGDFQRRVITLKIGAPLRVEFRGIASPSANSSVRGNTLLRATTVADASRYYGIQPLVEQADMGALELKVASVYAPIVPTAQREAAVSLVAPPGASALIDVGGDTFTDGPFEAIWEAGVPVNIPLTLSPAPGTLRLFSSSGFDSRDDGLGVVTSVPGSFGWHGSIDYASRTMTVASEFGGGAPFSITYMPQVEVSQAGHSKAEEITLANRGTVYAPVLDPLPSPGTLRVDYRALGRWCTLRDRGDGELVGDDPAYGTGLVDFVTGAATITLGALPDVGSSLVRTWGSPIHYEKRLADTGTSAFQDFTLANVPVAPGELDIVYTADGQEYTVSDNGTGGFAGGGVTGTVNYATGAVHLEYATRLPDFDSLLDIAYKSWVLDPSQGIVGSPVVTKELVNPASLGEAVLPASVSGVLGMTVTVVVNDIATTPPATLVPFKVDGSGTVTAAQEVAFRNDRARITMPAGTVLGLLNAGTGAITYNPTMVLPTAWYATYGTDHPVWSQGGYSAAAVVSAASVSYTPAVYVTDGGDEIPAGTAQRVYTSRSEELSIASHAPMHVDLTRTSTAVLVAGSVVFSLAGKRFFERSGTLYIDRQYNGSATAAGAIDYATGVATPTRWTRGAALGLAVTTALIKLGQFATVDAFFRTAGSPLRPGATYVQATSIDGVQLSGTADASGNIESTYVHGRVEQSVGVVSLKFGQWVSAAGNETAPWYDPADVVAGQIIRPVEVQPQTLRYSTVVLTSLPLSADILGLDTVRLPSDGRVPIYRPADVGVIHHTGSVNAGTPTAGQVIGVGRGYLDSIWLEDSARKRLAANLYAVNLEAGLVTMDAALSLAGYVPPIAVRHRIEEMLQITDVQINGLLSLSAPLSRAYPAGGQVSSALLFGDLFARVENVFDQRTWTGVWSDTLIGDQADTEYDDANYPIEVLNEGAVNERWRIHFTNGAGNYQVIGENLGVIATGNISADVAPVNLLTGKTYFVLRKEGWGVTPWAVGVQLRFNTVAAAPGFWLARTVLPGATLAGDSFDAQLRGDAD